MHVREVEVIGVVWHHLGGEREWTAGFCFIGIVCISWCVVLGIEDAVTTRALGRWRFRFVNQSQTAFTSPTAAAPETMLLVFQYLQSFSV
jgi:hypothetical protein